MDIFTLVPDSEIRTWVGPFADKELYFESGQEETGRFIRLAGIKPFQHILDLGCGCGKTAIHFTQYLSDKGSFTGIDNNRQLLDFCIEKIEPHFPNFHFQYIDVFNKSYNPDGVLPAGTVRIPLPDSSVDVIIANSLFTHMFFDDIESYMKEMGRVLKTGGKTISTAFLLNDRSLGSIGQKKAAIDFRHPIGPFSRTFDPLVPEEGIAHDEAAMGYVFKKLKLKIIRIEYGNWIKKGNVESFQDLILAGKTK